MCSICRSKNCIYRFDVDKWKPEDDLVVYPLPESDLTFLESVRVFEEFDKKFIPKGDLRLLGDKK